MTTMDINHDECSGWWGRLRQSGTGHDAQVTGFGYRASISAPEIRRFSWILGMGFLPFAVCLVPCAALQSADLLDLICHFKHSLVMRMFWFASAKEAKGHLNTSEVARAPVAVAEILESVQVAGG
jgi:hypothetical protein